MPVGGMRSLTPAAEIVPPSRRHALEGDGLPSAVRKDSLPRRTRDDQELVERLERRSLDPVRFVVMSEPEKTHRLSPVDWLKHQHERTTHMYPAYSLKRRAQRSVVERVFENLPHL